MAANNDFFVKFDSNAVAWASQLETQLRPAKNQIASMQALLSALESQANKTGSKLQQRLASGLPPAISGGPAAGGGNGKTPAGANKMVDNINHASDELDKVITQLAATVKGMKALPQTVGNAMRGIESTIKNLVDQSNGQGRSFVPGSGKIVQAGTPGALRHGSSEAAVYGMVGRALRNNALGTSPLPTSAATIGSVTRSDLGKAAADRIVRAIQDQTRTLSRGIPTSGHASAPATTVRRGAAPAAESSALRTISLPATDKSARTAQQRLAKIDADIAKIVAHLGKNADDASKAAVAGLRQQRAALASEAAKAERAEEGLTRRLQKQQRRAVAGLARPERPTLSEDEHDRRLKQLALINSPADPNFMSQVGRKRGQYGMGDLKQMAGALGSVGFPVQYSTRTKQSELAERLVQARSEYGKRYQGGDVPESLRTGNLSEKISKNVRDLIGDINKHIALAARRAEARGILSADARGGGDVGQPFSGRQGYGSGTMDPLRSPRLGIEALSTPAQVDAARALFSQVPNESSLARKHAARADFDPYDSSLSSQIKGKSQTADSARLAIRGLREATTELDKFGREFLVLNKRLDEAAAFIQRAKARAATGTSKPTDAANVVQAQDQVRIASERLSQKAMLSNVGLFQSPDYQAGLELRDRSRKAFEARQLEGRRQPTLATQWDLEEATAASIAGKRTGMGHRGLVSSVPGLQYTKGKGYNLEGGLSREDKAVLNAHAKALTNAQTRALGAGRKEGGVPTQAGSERIDKAFANLENKAVQFANTVQRLIGLSPSVENLTGRSVKSEANLAGEAARRKAREDAAFAARTGQWADDPRAGKKKSTPVQTQAIAEANGAVADLRAERRRLQQQPHTRAQIKDLEGQAAGAKNEKQRIELTAAAQAAREVRQRLQEINQVLRAAKGGGGAGGKPPTGGTAAGAASPGGRGESSRDLLQRILAKLGEIHTTLRGGVRITGGGTAGGRTGTGTGAPKPAAAGGKTAAAKEADDEKALLEIARQRRKEQRLANARQYVQHTDNQAQVRARRESEKDARLKREQERSRIELSNVMRRLDAAALREVDSLRAMNAAGESSVKIAAQQVRVYTEMSRALASRGMRAGDRHNDITTVLTSTGPASNRSEVDSIRRAARSTDAFRTVDDTMAQGVPVGGIFGGHSAFTQAMFGNHGFWSRVMASTGTFVVRNFTAGFVFGITNALQDVIVQAIETESTFIRVSSALEATGRSVGSLRTDLQGISSDYGVALTDVYNTAAGLTGLFDSTEDVGEATRVVSQLQMISRGALNAQEAMGTLASITSAYSDELSGKEGLHKIADVLTVIQERVGVNIEVTAEGVGRLAGLAQQVGLTFEQTAVFVGEIAKRTNQTGSAAGEQLSRIISVMQTGRGRNVLTENLGEDTGIGSALQSREYGQALEVLMGNWEGLTKAQQDNITTGLGGQRQAAAINALLNNSAEALDTVRAAENAKGQADERSAQMARTLNQQLKIFNENMVNLAQNLVRSGILAAFAALLMGINKLFSTFNHFFSKTNDFFDSNMLLRWAKNAGLGLVGLLVTVKLISRAFAGLKASIAAMPAASAFAQGASGRATAPPPVFGPQPATPMQRMRARISDASVRSFGGPISGVSAAAADPNAGPTSRFGRALEKVTAGPLQRVGGGLDRFGQAIHRSANTLRAQGVTGSATRYDFMARRFEGAGSKIAGIGTFTQEALRGQSPTARLLERGATRLNERASILNANAAMGTAGGASLAGQRAAAVASRVAASAATGTASAMTRLSVALRAAAMGGVMAQGAMAALSLGLVVAIMEIAKARQLAKDVDNDIEAVFGQDKPNAAGVEEDSYVGTSTERQEAIREGNKGPGGYAKAWWKTIASNFTDPTATLDEIGMEQAGDLDNETSNRQIDMMLAAMKKMRSISHGMANGVEEVSKVQQEAIDLIKNDQERMLKEGDYSKEQESAIAAYNEGVLNSIAKLGSNALLDEQGIGKLNALLAQQVDPMLALATMFAGASRSLMEQFEPLMDEMVAGIGMPDDSNVTKILRDLQDGGDSDSDIAQLQSDLNTAAIEGLQATYESMLMENSNATDDERAEVLSKIQNLMGQSNQLRDAVTSALTAEAQAALEYFSARGNVEGAQAATDAAVAALQGKLTLDLAPEKRRSIMNQIAQLEIAQTQALLSQRNSEGRAEISRTLNARRRLQLELGIARDSLRLLQERLASGGATQEQINAAEEAYNQALQASRQGRIDRRAAVRQTEIARIAPGDTVAVTDAQVRDAVIAADEARVYGVRSTQYQGALQALITAQAAASAAQFGVTRAQSELAAAYATARGDAVAAAQANAQVASVALAEAQARSGGVVTADVLSAQAALVSANAAIGQSQLALIQSRYDVSAALATAAGRTVQAARIQLKKARSALANALRVSGGENTAEVNAARATAISAEATARDARLQDELDTIDFNLQMGRITQGSAISALRQILRTHDLTKQQRRQLLLQIKGMQDSMADAQWNFGDIKMPSPYQMRRYIEQNRKGLQASNQKAASMYNDAYAQGRPGAAASAGMAGGSSSSVVNNQTTIQINGADVAKVRRVVEEVMGQGHRTRTAQPRRR